uniref:Uncharacterized protein n=1 Tax=viral metagenome TaxID=1070528 RepID=A0A6C0CJE0_9ZZZZ
MGNKQSNTIHASTLERPRCVVKGCSYTSYPEYNLCLEHIKQEGKEKRNQEPKEDEVSDNNMMELNLNKTLMKSCQARCLQKTAVTQEQIDRGNEMRDSAISEFFAILNTNNITDEDFHAIHKEMNEWLNHDLKLPEIRAKRMQTFKNTLQAVDAYLASKND